MTDPCADQEKVFGAAQGALGIAVERAQVLPDIIDFDELSDEDATLYSAVEEAQDWVDQAENALRRCKEAV